MMRSMLSRILGREASTGRRGPVKAVPKLLGVETLEGREVPAVTVSVSAGSHDLIITGDGGNDRIQLSQTLYGATIIQGMDGTVVNKVANGQVIRSFDNNLIVNLGNGNNVLSVLQGNGGVVANNAFINTGSGVDNISVYQLTLSNDLFVDTGAGDDGVFLDYVTARALGAAPNSSDHGINVYTRGGWDYVQIYHSTSGLDVTVLLDDGSVGETVGNDTLYMGAVSAADDFWLYGFAGNDWFDLNDIHANDNLAVFMGTGDDFLKLTNSGAGYITTDGGSGIDTVQYYNVGFYTWNHSGIEGFYYTPPYYHLATFNG